MWEMWNGVVVEDLSLATNFFARGTDDNDDSDCDWLETIGLAVAAAAPLPPAEVARNAFGASEQTNTTGAYSVDGFDWRAQSRNTVCQIASTCSRHSAVGCSKMACDFSNGDTELVVSTKKKQVSIVSTRHQGTGVRHDITIRRCPDMAFNPISEHKKVANIFHLSDTHIRRVRWAEAKTIRLMEAIFLTGNPLLTDFRNLHTPESEGNDCVRMFSRDSQRTKLSRKSTCPVLDWFLLLDTFSSRNRLSCLRPEPAMKHRDGSSVNDTLVPHENQQPSSETHLLMSGWNLCEHCVGHGIHGGTMLPTLYDAPFLPQHCVPLHPERGIKASEARRRRCDRCIHVFFYFRPRQRLGHQHVCQRSDYEMAQVRGGLQMHASGSSCNS